MDNVIKDFDPKVWVRNCQRCGQLEASRRWASAEAAAGEGVWHQRWLCRGCGMPDFELIAFNPYELLS